MVAYPQWRPGDCADSVSQSSCSIKEGVSNTIPSATPPPVTHPSSLALHRALDSSAAPMRPDLQAPPPRGRSHLPRRTDKPLINLLSTSYQPLSALPTAGHRSMFTSRPEAERVQAQADAEYALLLHPGTLAQRFHTTGRKLARYVGGGQEASLHRESPVRVPSFYSTAAMLQAKSRARAVRPLRAKQSIFPSSRREWLHGPSIASVPLTL